MNINALVWAIDGVTYSCCLYNIYIKATNVEGIHFALKFVALNRSSYASFLT